MKNRLMKVMLTAMMVAMSAMVSAQEGADITKVAEEGAKEVSQPGLVNNDSVSATVSIITCYPGSKNYELYGHTMVRVQIGDEDVLFNYGVFNFKQRGFIYRFVKGECDYVLAAYPTGYLTNGYENRRIVEQVLSLTDAQKQKIISYLWWNSAPENATYRYDWAYNNCATKPRDILEMVLDDSTDYKEPSEPHATFRSIMAYYDRNYPWQQLGIDLALGSGLDHELDFREQMFSPIKLEEALAGCTLERDGRRMPLVSETNVLVDGGPEGAAEGPTPLVLTPVFVFSLLLVLVLALTVAERRSFSLYRWLDSMVFGALGLAGLLLAFLVLVSTHYATSPNWNIAWVHPLALLPAIFVWVKKASKWLRVYHMLNAAVIVLLGAAWYWIPQVGNIAFVPMAGISLVRSVNYIFATRR